MKNIKAIIFDAYGTLFDVNSAAEKCKAKIGINTWDIFSKNNLILLIIYKLIYEKY